MRRALMTASILQSRCKMLRRCWHKKNKSNRCTRSFRTSQRKKCKLITKRRKPSSWSNKPAKKKRRTKPPKTAKQSCNPSSTNSRKKSTPKRTRLLPNSKRVHTLKPLTFTKPQQTCWMMH